MFQSNQAVDNIHNFCPWFSLSFLFTSNNNDKRKLFISGGLLIKGGRYFGDTW